MGQTTAITCVCALLALLVTAPAAAEERTVVALCPDVGEDPDVFVVRDGRRSIAWRLAAAGYDVERVDPWSGAPADERGFDAVVEEVYPALVRTLQRRGPVIWVGHGLCGLLPAAAAATGDAPVLAGWASVGTRMDYRQQPPSVAAWLDAWAAGAAPSADTEARTLLTGVLTDPRPGSSSRADVAALFGDRVARPPPAAVVQDLQRWYAEGRAVDRRGEVDYLLGLHRVDGPALLVAGCSDPVAPPEDVLPALDTMTCDVRYRMLSRINGHGEEFGHVGMLLSRAAPRGLDRVLLSWLAGVERLP